MSDPYRDHKKYHMANLIASDGSVSALCFDKPQRINMKRAKWTTDKSAVTCKKCLTLMATV